MDNLDANYWESRWQAGQTGWDIGQASPALIDYARKLPKDTSILIPGAGRAYEALWLHRQGFANVYVCDWAQTALDQILKQAPGFPRQQLLHSDFFKLNLQVDLILEQTFFCAIDVQLRTDYARKAYELLSPGGKIAGLFWAIQFDRQGPPFGGDLDEYQTVFTPYFEFLQHDISPLSIAPRKGTEYFLELRKKDLS